MSRRCLDPARPPVPWPTPSIYPGRTNTAVLVTNGTSIERQNVFLVRDDTTRIPPFAYQRIQHKRPIPLGENGIRGQVVFCVGFPSSEVDNDEFLFREPLEEEAQLVAVKQLRKRVYNTRLRRNVVIEETNENAYNEISAMRYLNPETSLNHHPVMGCIEALENEEYLYIVMPFISGGELHEHIPWAASIRERAARHCHMGLPEQEAKIVFYKIVKSVEFLHERGVCHRDLKNENIVMQKPLNSMDEMQVPLVEMHPTVIDLAMSMKVPSVSSINFSKILNTEGACGTLPFMAPEMLASSVQASALDGFQLDVWSLGIMLFNLLTGRRLYRYPIPLDRMYKHFLVEGGLVNDELNGKWLTKGQRLLQQETAARRALAWLGPLLEMITVVQRLDLTTRILLQGMLCPDPNRRFTLEQVKRHEWFRYVHT